MANNGVTMVPQAHGGALQRWNKGTSGNPNGRPTKAITFLLKRLNDKAEAEALVNDYLALCHSRDERIRLDALRDLLDRAGFKANDGSDRPMRELIIREYNLDLDRIG